MQEREGGRLALVKIEGSTVDLAEDQQLPFFGILSLPTDSPFYILRPAFEAAIARPAWEQRCLGLTTETPDIYCRYGEA